jgi:hypothetical protein
MSIAHIPPLKVGTVRSALLSALGGPAAVIETSSLEAREKRPELFQEPREQLDAYAALLDAIGWIDTEKPRTVKIDMDTHRWAFVSALEDSLRTERDIAATAANDGAAGLQRTAEREARKIEALLSMPAVRESTSGSPAAKPCKRCGRPTRTHNVDGACLDCQLASLEGELEAGRAAVQIIESTTKAALGFVSASDVHKAFYSSVKAHGESKRPTLRELSRRHKNSQQARSTRRNAALAQGGGDV